MIPPFDDGEGVQTDGPARKLLEQGFRSRALLDYVFACVNTACFAAPPGVKSIPKIVFDDARRPPACL